MHNKPSYEELEQKVRQLEKKVASLRQEQTFQDLAENSPDAICRINRELRYTYLNKAVENIIGEPASSLIGKTHQDLSFPENICLLCEQKITEVFETQKGLIFEFSLPSPTGAIYIQSHLVPEFTERDKVDTVLCVSRDITDLKKTHEALKESEEKYRLLHESMMDSFVSMDMQGRIKEFNKAYR